MSHCASDTEGPQEDTPPNNKYQQHKGQSVGADRPLPRQHLDEYRRKEVDDMANKALMPTKDFYKTFLPLPRRTSTISKTASTAPPQKMKTLFQSLRDARKKNMKEDLIATRFVRT